MRILFNRLTTLGNKTGVGHYAGNLLAALGEVAANDHIEGFPTGWPWVAGRSYSAVAGLAVRLRKRRRKARMFAWLAPLVKLSRTVSRKLRPWAGAWIQSHMRSMLEGGQYDLYHEPNFLPLETDLPTVVTIHDLSVLLYPEWHPASRVERHRRHFLRGLAQSRQVITVSDAVRRDLIRVLNVSPARVTRVYNGVSPRFAPLPEQRTEGILKHWGLEPGYLLHLGTLEPRKNLLMLMRAYCSLPRSLRDRVPLLLVGSWGWQDRSIRNYYHGHARHRGVRHLGYFPDSALPALYNGARALVCPSHYEGFGLPCMEMLACGGAVLASTAEVFRETLAGHAQLIPAEDVDGWRAAMAELIHDEDCLRLLRQGARRHAEGFSWKDSAVQTLQVYERAWAGSTLVESQPVCFGELERIREPSECNGAPEQPKLHIDLNAQPLFTGEHRFGWSYALDALMPLHHPEGIWLDSFLERTFFWRETQELAMGRIPYRRPWIGILHNPPGIPRWHDYECAPASLLAKHSFRESLPDCRGIFVLSDYLRDWLATRLSVPVVALRHPAPLDVAHFSMERFLSNPRPRLIQIGWFLRYLHSIYQLPCRKYRKTVLVSNNSHYPYTLKREREVLGLRASLDEDAVDRIRFLSNEAYDALLTENIAFCYLFDSSANNAVVECIAKHTPLVVNRLPAVVEYLGSEYPLYFDTLEEAAEKAECVKTVAAAHRYLARMRKDWLRAEFFRASLAHSTIYRSLPARVKHRLRKVA